MYTAWKFSPNAKSYISYYCTIPREQYHDTLPDTTFCTKRSFTLLRSIPTYPTTITLEQCHSGLKILHTVLYTIVPSRDTREFIHVILQSPGVTVPQYYTIACDCAPCSNSLLTLLRIKYDSSRTSVYMRYAVVDRSGKDTLCSRVPTHITLGVPENIQAAYYTNTGPYFPPHSEHHVQ